MHVKWSGDEALLKKLQRMTDNSAVKTIVHKNGDELNANMKRNTKTAFKKGYSTGQTASSINTEISDGGLTATVQPTTEYAPYVEYGTRKMTAEPFVKPAFDEQEQKFKNDLRKLVQ